MKREKRNNAKLLTNTEMTVKMVEKRRVQIITQRRPRTSPRYPHAYDDTIIPKNAIDVRSPMVLDVRFKSQTAAGITLEIPIVSLKTLISTKIIATSTST